MSQNQPSSSINTSPLNVVIGGAGLGLLLAAATVAYVRSQRQGSGKLSEALEAARSGVTPSFNLKGRWALNAAIKMIEHDASRKVLLTVLKSIAKRSK